MMALEERHSRGGHRQEDPARDGRLGEADHVSLTHFTLILNIFLYRNQETLIHRFPSLSTMISEIFYEHFCNYVYLFWNK